MNFLRSPNASLIAALAACCLLSGFGAISYARDYECAGKSDNGMVPYREFPSLHIEGRRLKVSGSDIFSTYDYEICAASDALISFATQQEICRAPPGNEIAAKVSRGSLDITTGLLELTGAQGLHGEYQCREVTKK